MPRKPANKSASTNKINKSAWIRALPATMSAKDAVTKGAADGIKLALTQVYAARRSAKKGKSAAKGGGTPKGKGGRPKGSRNKTLKQDVSGDLSHIKRAVFEHGFSRVEAFLAELKKSVGL